MKTVSLFSGIGGIEYGLEARGFESLLLCEIDPIAREVLQRGFPHARLAPDIFKLRALPTCDLVTAGFPCQDLSQAGRKRGIKGKKSSVVERLFELIDKKRLARRPPWLLIENVPYMLRLDRGQAMSYLVRRLEALGYRWAYRTVDARCFGLPQRRPRVLLLASLASNPADVLFYDNYRVPDLDGKPASVNGAAMYGFYWTEGSRGVGWAREAVPPIKCGSTLGIASPPAVWLPSKNFVGTIDIRDAERLQGFPEDWTELGSLGLRVRNSLRWRLVGNAVSTKMSEWIGRLLLGTQSAEFCKEPMKNGATWPDAAFGASGERFVARVSKWAAEGGQIDLSNFLKYELKPLSKRATEGFLRRADVCTNVVYAPKFLKSLRMHAERVER